MPSPRQHIRRPGARSYINYPDYQLNLAVESCRKGMSLRNAARKFGIPKSTIDRKVKELNMNSPGRPRVFTAEVEQKLVHNLIIAADWGFPLSTLDLQMIIKHFLDSKGLTERRFKSNIPGRKWLEAFLTRHKKKLAMRLCENLKRVRAGITRATIKDYFERLGKTLEGVKPEAIINYDETNLTDDPKAKKFVFRRGSKHCHRIMDTSKTSNSIMFAGTGSGHVLPVYVVYKAENLYKTWMENGPKNAVYYRSKSGWFNEVIFVDWFEKILLPYVAKLPKEEPKVVIGDNLSSHLSTEIIELCEQKNIRFTLLPTNSTHICQPLDVVFFRPLKKEWRATLELWKRTNRGTLPKDQFPRQVKLTLDQLQNASENVKSGFAASGIYPLDAEKVLKHIKETDPNVEDNAENVTLINDSFLTQLKTLYRQETGAQPKRTRKKINIEAGKGITLEDLLIEEELQEASLDDPTKKGQKRKNNSVPSEEGETSGVANKNVKRSRPKAVNSTRNGSSEEESDPNQPDSCSDVSSTPEDFEEHENSEDEEEFDIATLEEGEFVVAELNIQPAKPKVL